LTTIVAILLQAKCLLCRPTNRIKALMETTRLNHSRTSYDVKVSSELLLLASAEAGDQASMRESSSDKLSALT